MRNRVEERGKSVEWARVWDSWNGRRDGEGKNGLGKEGCHCHRGSRCQCRARSVFNHKAVLLFRTWNGAWDSCVVSMYWKHRETAPWGRWASSATRYFSSLSGRDLKVSTLLGNLMRINLVPGDKMYLLLKALGSVF